MLVTSHSGFFPWWQVAFTLTNVLFLKEHADQSAHENTFLKNWVFSGWFASCYEMDVTNLSIMLVLLVTVKC